MVDLLLAGDRRRLRKKGVVLSVYDPCCGSGGMLTIAKEHITVGETRDGEPVGDPVNPGADTHLFRPGGEPGDLFAISKSDLFMKSEDGRDAENVLFGSTLSNDRRAAAAAFEYLIANPPYGKDWKRDQDAVRAEKIARPAAPRSCSLQPPAAVSGARTRCNLVGNDVTRFGRPACAHRPRPNRLKYDECSSRSIPGRITARMIGCE